MNKIFRHLLLALSSAVVIAVSGAASAQTVISQPASTQSQIISNGLEQWGQIITAPPAGPLTSWTFHMDRSSPTFSVEPRVYEWDGVQLGALLYTGPVVNVTAAPGSPVAHTFATGGLALTSGQQYALIVRQAVPGEAGGIRANAAGGYADGQMVFGNGAATVLTSSPAVDLRFEAVFSAPATIPTLSEWAMILFGLLLASGAALVVHRRSMV